MLHGLSSYANHWRELGYVDDLRDRYRLTLVDSRGHGSSDKPQSADAYARRQQSRDIVAVLDEEGFESVHFWGYSFGAWIGYQAGAGHPERFRSMILGAQHPYSYRRTRSGCGSMCRPFSVSRNRSRASTLLHVLPGWRRCWQTPGWRGAGSDQLSRCWPTPAIMIRCRPARSGPPANTRRFLLLRPVRSEHGGDFFDTALILPVAKAFLARVEANAG